MPLRCLLALLSLLWLSGTAAIARAQVNAESLAEAVKEPGWGGGAKASLTLSRGNVDLLGLRGEAALRFASEHPAALGEDEFLFRDRVLFYGSAGLTDVERETVANNGYAHLRYTRMQWLRFGGELFGQAQYDEIRLLSRRLVFGTGIRAVLVDLERFAAWLGSGYMYEKERRNIPPEDRPPRGPDPISMTNHRWSNYASFVIDVVEETVKVVNVIYVQPRFDLFRDVQILEQLSLVVKLTDRLNFNSDLEVRHDSRAPRAVEKTDVQLSQGISLTL